MRSSAPQRKPVNTNRALFVLLITFACLATIYSVVNPLFEAPDETYHMQMVKRLAEGGGLPVQDPAKPGPWLQEGSQPPLYYWLAALATCWVQSDDLSELQRVNGHVDLEPARPSGYSNMILHVAAEGWPYRGAALAAHLARGLSVLFGTLTVLFTYLIGLELQPRRPGLALAAAAVAAFTPMFLFISASVNNDNLIITLSTVSLWLMLRLLREPPTPARWALLGGVIGLAALSKVSALGLLLLAALALARVSWKRRDWRIFFWGGSCIVGVTALLAGWWYYRNWRLYGDPLGWNVFLDIVGQRTTPPTVRGILGEWTGFVRSYWGVFGWSNVMAPDWFYHLCDAVTLFAGGGLVIQLLQRRRAMRPLASPAALRLGLISLWPVAAMAGVVRYTLLTPANQGRLVFPAIAPLSYLMVLGWTGYVDRKTKNVKRDQEAIGEAAAAAPVPPGVGARPAGLSDRPRGHASRITQHASRFAFHASRLVPLALMAVLAAWTPFGVIAPAYARPALLSQAELAAIPQRLDLAVGDEMELLGYRLEQTTVRPGEELRLTLYWRARRPVPRNYSAFVHLLDQNEIKIAQHDALIGRGLFPTSLWRAGDAIAETYVIPVPAETFRPNRLQLVAGLYSLDGGGPLPVRDGEGRELGAAMRLCDLGVPAGTQDGIANPVDANLGHRVALAGYDLDCTTLRPGETLRLTLFLRPQAPLEEDHTVVAHVLGDDGSLWAGQAEAAEAWPHGQVTPATYDLALRPDTPPGEYYVDAGLYDNRDQTLDRRALLTRIRVVPTPPREATARFGLPRIQHPLDVALGDVARLRGFALSAEALNPHEPLQVTLYWQAMGPALADYKVFVHLLDGQGQLIAQHDSPPALGSWPTTRWAQGQVIVDRHDLSFLDATYTGEVRLQVGLYDPNTMRRLVTGEGSDQVTLPVQLAVQP